MGRSFHRTGLTADVLAALAAAVLVWAAAVEGDRLIAAGVRIYLDFLPLFASWAPHTGPGTLPAVLLAVAVVAVGPGLAARMPWWPLLGATYLTSLAWTVCLTLADGWEHGVLDKLTSEDEYLHDIPRVGSISAMLREFSTHILEGPGAWTTHVAGHPPGALLIFVWLQRIGLGGGVAAAALCVVVGASASVGIAVTLRALGEEVIARRFLPFGVLTPAAVWVGVSADGLFAGVLAWAIALLAIGCATRSWRCDLAALAGGLVLGFAFYLSYGLLVAGLLPLTVVVVTRRVRPAVAAVAGVAVVAGVFTLSGFSWWEGYELLRVRYYQGIASTRPYGYFIWANLASLAVVIGPAGAAGLRRFAVAAHRSAAQALVLATVVAVLAADLSGMSKAEVERIWLPFVVWLMLPCALLPARQAKWWLAAQAALALLTNHLLRTRW